MSKDTFYKLTPMVTYRPWGGNQLVKKLNIDTSISRPGEIIAAAGFENRDTEVAGLGVTLSQLFKQKPEWFGVKTTKFPITINLIDAIEYLSVQVHPDNDYAYNTEGGIGCPEAWLVLDCEPGSKIILGHTAPNNDVFAQMAKADDWDHLLRWVEVEKGDFFYLPPGTIHSIGAGVQIFEVTHASDIVYRLYDHGRNDKNRPLELDKVLDVVYSPQHIEAKTPKKIKYGENLTVTEYMDEPGLFTIHQLEIRGATNWQPLGLGVLTVIEGQGFLNEKPIKSGDSVLILCPIGDLRFDGCFTAMQSSYRPLL